ncbi:SDR family oxidoreductase [Microbacterium sediminis]|uniref:3-ketoacyl-ACP reductase n=1 Tax=Microbacterium sediminis TaxID=904291 RepID=A0A1B9N941_9MICO|nr:SDR family oxidoreductase [Microbacterium sediminis]OCG73110.1 3-ketoacyl-ACP reductase [Microbacterium sediminis]QBR74461.1 SDR family oxidoreductase [Microbacterium sediminis]
MSTSSALRGRTALITGASRVGGIGAAVARRLAAMGASVVIHHHRPHDVEQPWGADELAAVRASIEPHLAAGARLWDLPGDLALPDAPEQLIARAIDVAGPLDILVCNHAMSGTDGTLADIGIAELDAHWATDARSVLLATKAFAARHDAARPGGRVIWMTSGQGKGPMRGEVAYAAAKAALAGITMTVADELADQGIVLNTVNPGPVNTGFLDPGNGFDDATIEWLRGRFPSGRFGTPEDPARLIGWLVSDDGEWVVGQVIDSEGGFRRA